MKSIVKYLNPIRLVDVLSSIIKEDRGWRKILGLFLVYSRVCYLLQIKRKGYKLNFFPTALSVTFFQHSNAWRYEELFLERYLKPQDIIVDIGANIGNVGIRAASLFDTVKVYMIEAHPVVFNFMEQNIKLNRLTNIVTFNVALGNKDNEFIKFSNHLSDDLNSIILGKEEGISVKLCKLDSILMEEKIDFIKVDVEGFEFEVFKGSERLLKRTSCIMFESWDDHYKKYDTDSAEVICYLKNFGFEVYKWSEDTILKLETGYRSLNCENLLAIKNYQDFQARMKLNN
ncbi:MAG TPA: FkbM family methyltransferase [Saprospiraceae bacterium]|nr:FkbM family methyltransferase [Saprospiraceae bacterium]HRG19648.1 FkbM family methyltransferase [Saprospiraceae bacterium]